MAAERPQLAALQACSVLEPDSAGGGGACCPPNAICLDPVSEAHLLVNEGQVYALCRGARLHTRVGCAEVNRCAVLYKPAWAALAVFGVSAPCPSSASAHFQIFLLFFHPLEIWCQNPPLPLTVCMTEWSSFTSLGLIFSTCLMELVPHPACSTNSW